MFSLTTLPALYYKISDNRTSTDITPTNQVTITTSSNGVERVERREIVITCNSLPTFELDAEEILHPVQKHKLIRKSLTPIRQAPWQAKWRLRQQRPRDGLRP